MPSRSGKQTVYTDGSRTGTGRAGAGVFWGPRDSRNLSNQLPGKQTALSAEIKAAEKAIRQAERSNVSKLCVATDSKALVHHASGSKMAGVSAPTRDAIKGLQGTLAKTPVEVSWKVVEGHSGIPGNVRADHLAKAGAGIAK